MRRERQWRPRRVRWYHGLFRMMDSLLSIVVLLGAAAVLAGRYRQVLTGLKARRRGGSLRLDRVQAAGPRRAVLRKEETSTSIPQ